MQRFSPSHPPDPILRLLLLKSIFNIGCWGAFTLKELTQGFRFWCCCQCVCLAADVRHSIPLLCCCSPGRQAGRQPLLQQPQREDRLGGHRVEGGVARPRAGPELCPPHDARATMAHLSAVTSSVCRTAWQLRLHWSAPCSSKITGTGCGSVGGMEWFC